MRGNPRTPGERSSALWGTGNRGGESRSNALWGTGKSGRGLVTVAIAALTLVLPLAASAGKPAPKLSTSTKDATSYVSPEIVAIAEKDPSRKIHVIIQHAKGTGAGKRELDKVLGSKLQKKHAFIGGLTAELPAAAARGMANAPGMIITLDAPVKLSEYTSKELWTHQNGVNKLWGTKVKPAPKAPAIAIVDSGIGRHSAFGDGSRIVQRQVFTSLDQDNSKLDGRGHGTFVAGIAAGEGVGYAGAAPNANLIDLDVMDDSGMAYTSDVIAAAEWIYENRDNLKIKVANFSLHSMARNRFYNDPLNRAVEKLWFGGVTVVAAVGNYGSTSGPSGVLHAPATDPFIITVGAVDLAGTIGLGNDIVAPWSAYGRTVDGFAKPEIAAAGRYMVGPVPADSTLAQQRADKLVGTTGYIQLSGTSFAAPVVAGIAAQLLALNPNWTPDQVKGALMYGARPVPHAPFGSYGVGEVNAVKSAKVTNPPNPNAALNKYVVTNATTNEKSFDAVSWDAAVKADVSWDAVSYSDVSWAGVSWDIVSYSDVSYSDVSYSDVSYSDVSYEDATTADPLNLPDALLDAIDALDAASDPELRLGDETTVTAPSTESTTSTTDSTTSTTVEPVAGL